MSDAFTDCAKNERSERSDRRVSIQTEPTADDTKTSLEEKIIAAKEVGLKFKLIPPGQANPSAAIGEMYVLQTWSDSDFEKALDNAMAIMRASKYLTLLKKHNLIK